MDKKEKECQLIEAISKQEEPQSVSFYSEQFKEEDIGFSNFVKWVAQLEGQGKVRVTNEGNLVLPLVGRQFIGTFSRHPKGFGFVKTEELETDLFLPREEAEGVLSGDKLLVEVSDESRVDEGQSAIAKKIDIVERTTDTLMGAFHQAKDDKGDFIGMAEVKNKGDENFIVYLRQGEVELQENDLVVLQITSWPTEEMPDEMEGIATSVLGNADDPTTEILYILNLMKIPYIFPEEVEAEAEALPDEISEEELEGRVDYRDWMTITVDGASSKDLDDAISLKMLDNGHYLLGVHIADVSYYVTPGTALDAEALHRGTSVYLTDRVIPMLPRRISNNLASLQPNEDRLTMTAVMEINSGGKVVDYKIHPSVIRSNYRMTYDGVNAILMEKDEETRDLYRPIVKMLEKMEELHNILVKMRTKRGAIEFDTKEAEIKVDATGFPTAIVLRERGTGERMIESFMLAANETVAKAYRKMKLPFVYRIHGEPDEDKLSRFVEMTSSFGVGIQRDEKGKVKSKAMQQVIEQVKGEPYEPLVKTLMLRSMQQAKYDVTPIGHFGLAAKDYTHFTSPIRRYPDLMVHRLIRQYLTTRPETEEEKEGMTERLQAIAESNSKAERRSVDAEREVDALKKTQYMEQFVGQDFEAMISSVVKFGFFIELDNTVEGLVHIRTLRDDFYEYDEDTMSLQGQRTGKAFHLGDNVTVRLMKADVEQHKLDFEIVIDGQLLESSRDFSFPSQSVRPSNSYSQGQDKNNHFERESRSRHTSNRDSRQSRSSHSSNNRSYNKTRDRSEGYKEKNYRENRRKSTTRRFVSKKKHGKK